VVACQPPGGAAHAPACQGTKELGNREQVAAVSQPHSSHPELLPAPQCPQLAMAEEGGEQVVAAYLELLGAEASQVTSVQPAARGAMPRGASVCWTRAHLKE